MRPSGSRVEKALSAAEVVVVGAGLYGLVVARELADAGTKVLIIEKRPHIGGNSYSFVDPDTKIEIHKYGSHLFHTSNVKVWKWVNRFTKFTDYRHRVFSVHKGRLFEMPPTLLEISHFYPGVISADDARRAITEDSIEIGNQDSNFETKAISLVGRKMYKALIAGYTEKQWQLPPSKLPSSYVTRLPFRTSHQTGYFLDTYQGLPECGYGELANRIAKHPQIEILLNFDFFDARKEIPSQIPVVYTGPIDQFFDYSAGMLRWRTLDFQFETLDRSDFQSASVINYADIDVPWTRIHEFRHLHPERTYTNDKTVIAREYSREAGLNDEPYYPVNSPDDRDRLKIYRKLARETPNVFFGGRLATYLYLDMHMAIASALKDFDQTYSSLNRRRNS